MKIKLLIITFLSAIGLFAQTETNILSHAKWLFKSNKKFPIWMDAQVPGNVHTDLLRLNKIPNPHKGGNEDSLNWIEAESFIYKTSFEISESDLLPNNFTLFIESLDTHAKLYLNNTYIGSNQNQFVPLNLEVKSYLKAGKNELLITFESSTSIAKHAAQKLSYTLPGEERVFVRKAQYQFGWDWSPRMVTYGIGNISLKPWQNAKILHIQYQQILNKDSSISLPIQVTVESDKAQNIELSAHIVGGQNNRVKKKFKLVSGTNTCLLNLTIKNPIWWWSNGMGKAHLYGLKIELLKDKQKIAEYQEKIGIRTIEWVQEKDDRGQSFYLKLNGKPVFLKGANYIPPHHFLNDLNEQVYVNLVEKAAAANMNMLRVWGGGVYANNAFYDACDSLGILVWQDFMFACAMYPSDSSFLHNVQQEITAQVVRLRNHASLAIWCGNNENAEGWHHWAWQKQWKYSYQDSSQVANSYFSLFDSLIPKTIKLADPNRFYWPSSPSFGWGTEKSLYSGDVHYWGVWWGMEPFEMYQKKVGRFVSEYGFQAMPNLHTLNEMQLIKNNQFDSNLLKSHQKHPKGFETIQTYLDGDYPKPNSPQEFTYLTQLVQAKGIKMAMESHRAAKPYCMGSLYWQLNDCWPAISWSSLDFYNRKKALHYQIKNNFAPNLLVVNIEGDSAIVQVISDKLEVQEGTLQLILWRSNGEALDQHILGLSIPANSNKTYKFGLNQNLNWQEKNQWVLQANLLLPHGEVAKQAYFFVAPKNLKLSPAKLQIENVSAHEISLYSETLIKDLAIYFEDPSIEISDNYFDLMPYQKVILKISGDKNFDNIHYNIQNLNNLLIR